MASGKRKEVTLVDEMIEKRLCVSKAEARKMVDFLGEEKVKEKLSRIKIFKRSVAVN
jgi:hypothetical protein